jgi:hypothetical protein
MYTTHAQSRLQQRCISMVEAEIVKDYGQVEFHRGREIYSLRRKDRDLIKSEFPTISMKTLNKLANIYVVAEGELVITVAYTRCRHKQNR